MTQTATIDESDVRDVVRLLGHIADLDAPMTERKHALMDGLCEMLDADAWMWVVSRFDRDSAPMAIHCHHGGFSERQIGMVFEATQDPDHPPLEDAGIFQRLSQQEPFACRRVDVVPDDDEWYGEHFELYRRPMNIDEFIYGIFPVAGNLISGIGLHRTLGREAFTERDRRLVEIVITEIPWLHRAGLPDQDLPALDQYGLRVMDLTPRLRTVFGLLIQGWKRPAIAQHLGISENTAKVHIRDVYRHFDVDDHVGLLRRFMSH